jgi:uncharacterized SAM-binding protein YcdF (DUF218 family)
MEEKSIDELAKILWNYNQLQQVVKKAGVIITLGSQDILVAKKGSELFLNKYAPVILFSGGYGRLSDTSLRKPEAELFADIAMKMGISPKDILIESKSTNSEENLHFSMKTLNERRIVIDSVILVHKPYMERRQFATWKKLFPDIEVVITSPQFPYDEYIKQSGITKEETINIIVGETQRIKLYPNKGFMIYQEIPDDVWEAYEQLVERGFVTQLINE